MEEMRLIIFYYNSQQYISNYPSFTWAFPLARSKHKRFTFRLLCSALKGKKGFVLNDTKSTFYWAQAYSFFKDSPSDFKYAYIVGE
jgi:hypothetical protein